MGKLYISKSCGVKFSLLSEFTSIDWAAKLEGVRRANSLFRITKEQLYRDVRQAFCIPNYIVRGKSQEFTFKQRVIDIPIE